MPQPGSHICAVFEFVIRTGFACPAGRLSPVSNVSRLGCVSALGYNRHMAKKLSGQTRTALVVFGTIFGIITLGQLAFSAPTCCEHEPGRLTHTGNQNASAVYLGSKELKETSAWLTARSESARKLIADGSLLRNHAKQFATSISKCNSESSPRLLIAANSSAGGTSGRSSHLTYSDILTQYHDALAAYMAHRKAVQEHISQFHQQSKMQQAIDVSINVPVLKPLTVQAQDECAALQAQEKQLQQMELNLKQMIDVLITERGQVPPATYSSNLMTAQAVANSQRNAAANFETTLVAKQDKTNQELHDKIHLAEDAGDFVESQKVFAEANRREAIVQEETERAQMHMGLADAFMAKLQLLGSQAPSTTSSGADENSFANSDAELDAEYQRVQQLYSLLQAAGPQSK